MGNRVIEINSEKDIEIMRKKLMRKKEEELEERNKGEKERKKERMKILATKEG